MFWLKVMLDWSNVGGHCKECGLVIISGTLAYLCVDSDMKIVDIKCPNCFHGSYPEGL